ncbi:hypothetical protein EVAR_39076_1 [Eumeta japonica]|uniref:Uncharacterized protein n=1 Tax=Eumeta variegata TaxID=151549 RepID=A0A4C1WNF3_EUMVA|nr:hypothetical protein EVAR_39076_1 [Eumeta japonica]
MGNVQCCSSGRLHEGARPDKPATKGKSKNKKKKKHNKNEQNGGDKPNGLGVEKTEETKLAPAVASPDGADVVRATPAPAAVPSSERLQMSPPSPPPAPVLAVEEESHLKPSESTAAARERFFGQCASSSPCSCEAALFITKESSSTSIGRGRPAGGPYTEIRGVIAFEKRENSELVTGVSLTRAPGCVGTRPGDGRFSK